MKTHCCFCGQQCGIQLKVRDNEVIGFEPWEEFPFNRGMLCPKGVKRYLQGSHPDRLTTALRRDTSAASGFSPLPYDEAIARVAAEIGRHSADARHRRHRRARRRQPDDREDLSARQVRARVPEDAVHRLQRPAVHGQRRRREQEGVRHRPHDEPVVRHGRDGRDLGRRARTSPSARRSRPTTSGRRASRARRSSSRIRASRPSPAPATCTCRSSRAATRRCSPASCRS